mmetsp:Transcript_55750/g.90205  ORF Transcript_55750/g.90205 Transcript_55750/m.90205 type:complete len:270 (-) Transcript_55750:163-972(-)
MAPTRSRLMLLSVLAASTGMLAAAQGQAKAAGGGAPATGAGAKAAASTMPAMAAAPAAPIVAAAPAAARTLQEAAPVPSAGEIQNGKDMAYCDAVKERDMTKLKAALVSGANIDTCLAGAGDGWSMLTTVVMGGTDPNLIAIGQYLIAQGADVDLQDRRGRTPLFFAARFGNIDLVKDMLKVTKNLRPTDQNGVTALYHAARQGHAAVCSLMIAAGAADPMVAELEPDMDSAMRAAFGLGATTTTTTAAPAAPAPSPPAAASGATMGDL